MEDHLAIPSESVLWDILRICILTSNAYQYDTRSVGVPLESILFIFLCGPHGIKIRGR
jgi:hypothetical protein